MNKVPRQPFPGVVSHVRGRRVGKRHKFEGGSVPASRSCRASTAPKAPGSLCLTEEAGEHRHGSEPI